MRSRFPIVLVLALCLAAVATVTAVRIELGNAASGGRLDHPDIRDDGTPVTWRISYPSDLSVDPRSEASDSLRELLGTWGLAQYPIVTIGMLAAITAVFRSRGPLRRLALSCVLLLFFEGTLMVWRGYFSVLGW